MRPKVLEIVRNMAGNSLGSNLQLSVRFFKLLLSSAPDMRYLPGFADHCDLIFLTAVLITGPWGWGEGGLFKEGLFKEGFASDTR